MKSRRWNVRSLDARAAELADRLGLAADLVAAWLRAAHAQGLVREHGQQYRIGAFVAWLLDAPQAATLHALLDQATDGYGPTLGSLPELMKGAERPEFGSSSEAVRLAAITRLVEKPALRALASVPGARSARRVLASCARSCSNGSGCTSVSGRGAGSVSIRPEHVAQVRTSAGMASAARRCS